MTIACSSPRRKGEGRSRVAKGSAYVGGRLPGVSPAEESREQCSRLERVLRADADGVVQACGGFVYLALAIRQLTRPCAARRRQVDPDRFVVRVEGVSVRRSACSVSPR